MSITGIKFTQLAPLSSSTLALSAVIPVVQESDNFVVDIYELATKTNETYPNGDLAYSLIQTNSGIWEQDVNVLAEFQASSGSWEDSSNVVEGNSAKWDSNYSTVLANSATWEQDIIKLQDTSSEILILSGGWEDTKTAVQANSASWDGDFCDEIVLMKELSSCPGTDTISISANLDLNGNSILNVAPASITFVGGGSIGGNEAGEIVVDNIVVNNSLSATTFYVPGSGNSSDEWDSTYTTVNTNSATWDNTSSVVQTNSASWVGGGSDVSALSGNWENTYTTVQTNSASWVGGGGGGGTSGTTLSGTTANDTETEIFIDGGASQMTIATDTTWMFSSLIAARSTTGTDASAGYKIEGVIKNDGGTTSLVGTVAKTVFAEEDATWDATVAADNGTNALAFLVTGDTTDSVSWVATVNKTEVT